MSGPPVLLVLFDQLRADALGFAGHPLVRTPHLDRLASEAVWFSQALTPAPLCRPARFSLLTGLPVHVHGLDSNRRVLDPDALPSHVRELRDAGYRTAVVGKTHLHDGRGHLDDHRGILGAWGYADAVELPDAQEHRLHSAHSDALGPRKHALWRDHVAHHPWLGPPPDHAPWHLSTDDHLDVCCARLAAERVRADRGDRPLYLQVGFPGPHPPLDAPSSFRDALAPDDLALPALIPAAQTGPVSPLASRYRRGQARRTADELRQLRVAYLANVGLVDHAFGLLWEAVVETGLADRAWTIVTADHGALAGDHGLVGKVRSYEPALRIPLLVRPPGGRLPHTEPEPVDLLDVVATIRGLAGLPSLQGHDLRATPPAGRSLVHANLGVVGLRTPTHTLVWDRALARPVELYDRVVDPHQLHNVVEEPAQADVCALLVGELRRTGALG